MPPEPTTPPVPHRRVSHASLVCFAIAAIAFGASALGMLVHQPLTGSLAISATAAVGLIYLAMGLLNLGYEADRVEVIVTRRDEARERIDSPAGEPRPAARLPSEISTTTIAAPR